MAKLAALVGDSTRIERVFGTGARVRAMNPQSDGDFYYTHEVARADGSKIQLGCRMSAEMRAKIALERFAIDNALVRLL